MSFKAPVPFGGNAEVYDGDTVYEGGQGSAFMASTPRK